MLKGYGGLPVGEWAVVGAMNVGVVKESLGERNPTTGHTLELVWKEVGILNAETREARREAICFSISIVIKVMANGITILNERTISVRKNSQRDNQSISKDAWSMGAVSVWIVEHESLVPSSPSEKFFGGSFALIGINWILGCGGGPHAPGGIPADGDWFYDSLFFTCDEFSGESRGELKRGFLFLGAEWSGLCLGGSIPMECAGCGVEFLDGNIFNLYFKDTTTVGLEAD